MFYPVHFEGRFRVGFEGLELGGLRLPLPNMAVGIIYINARTIYMYTCAHARPIVVLYYINKGRRGNACELAEDTPSAEAVDGPLSAYSMSEVDENSGRPAALLAPLGGVTLPTDAPQKGFFVPVRSLLHASNSLVESSSSRCRRLLPRFLSV